MILTAQKIQEEVEKGNIMIDPFDPNCLNPNSYNFHLDKHIEIYENQILDPKIEQPTKKLEISESGMVIYPNELYLGCTVERMGSNKYAPFIYGRSSIGRLGLFVQITAPLGDIGFNGKWTLQLNPVKPLKIYPGMRIGQIFFLKPLGEITLYSGKYQNSSGPNKSQIYKDFQKNK